MMDFRNFIQAGGTLIVLCGQAFALSDNPSHQKCDVAFSVGGKAYKAAISDEMAREVTLREGLYMLYHDVFVRKWRTANEKPVWNW